jgi:hypothetical protein
MPFKPIHRWVLILLLLVYPFQVALAMADKCCVTTAAGVTHHVSVQDGGTAAAAPEPVFLDDDDGPSMADPHCPACMFGHILTLPSEATVIPAQRHRAPAVAALLSFPSSPPAARPERPKWPAAAE